jgi:hypothetical protein
MSDAAAVGLGEWFLADPQGRSIETLVEILQGDPPLALWVALKADRLPSAPPRSIADLAALLAEHGPAWLQWDAGPAAAGIDAALPEATGETPTLRTGTETSVAFRSAKERGFRGAKGDQATIIDSPALRDEIAARVATAVVASELAAEAAAVHGETATRQARLLGLLQDPDQWLSALARAGCGQSAVPLPKWLAAQHFDPAAVRAVAEAVRSMVVPTSGVGVSPASSSSNVGVQPALPGILGVLRDKLAVSPAYLPRAVDAASRWAATHLSARWLSPLMARLAGLSVLEGAFREAVEAEKIAALAEFAAGAGHEINNPLAVIAGRAQLLLRDEADLERRRDLAVINVQAMRVNEMIADLRLFATPPDLERQALDLRLLVRRLIDEMRPIAIGQDTTLCLVEGPGAVRIEADPVQLTVAVRALCQNALEALGQRGRIEIAVDCDGGEARIEVADDGPGISPQQRPHLFEPFYSARQAGRGVGMGLSKCWRIATQHGGRIEVGNRAGCGAVFTIRLPCIAK